MTEDSLKPALTAEEWAQPLEHGQRLWTFDNDVQVAIGADGVEVNWDGAVYDSRMQPLGDKAVAVIALINAALPDDSPYKITRADIDHLRWLADHEGGSVTELIAAKLDAILPPTTE